MSILNVWVEPGSALLAVDTQASVPGAGRMDGNKLFSMPADRMVVACRGNMFLLNALIQLLHCFPGGVDVVAPVLAGLCTNFAGQIDAHAQQHGHSERFDEAEIVIVGWSEREARMKGYACVRMAGEGRFELTEIETPHPDRAYRLGPNADWQRVLPPDCREHMEAIASTQVRYMRRLHPDVAIGGRLLMAEVTELEISVRELLRFPERG